MHGKFKELLHDFKVEAFRVAHDQQNVEKIAEDCMHITDEVLHKKYSYHFHKLPDADRAEIINMINNYTREAILPPVVQSLVERQVKADKRIDALVALIEKMLEVLSTDPAEVR